MPNNYTYITGAATTVVTGIDITRTLLHAININKTLVGTLTIKSDTTTIGIFAPGTLPGCYWRSEHGVLIPSLTIVNSNSEDVTVVWSNI